MKRIIPSLFALLATTCLSSAQVSGTSINFRSMPPSSPENTAVDRVFTILLDFDGETLPVDNGWTQRWWQTSPASNGQQLNLTQTHISTTANATHICNLVAEDFRPFRINVTSLLTDYNAAPATRRASVIFTNSSAWLPGAPRGVAFANQLNTPGFNQALVFTNLVGQTNFTQMANVASCALGQLFGLQLDGQTGSQNPPRLPVQSYGGAAGWAPIMGMLTNSPTSPLPTTQWNNGSYAFADNSEDDLLLLAQRLDSRFSNPDPPTNPDPFFRVDEWGTGAVTDPITGITYTLRENLVKFGTNTVGKTGVISRVARLAQGVWTSTFDIDHYFFRVPTAGVVNLDLKPSRSASGTVNYYNLDTSLSLYNAAGEPISNFAPLAPDTSENAVGAISLPSGLYYVTVSGTGKTSSYDAYGSVGQYDLRIGLPSAAQVITVEPRAKKAGFSTNPSVVGTNASERGERFNVTVNSEFPWSAVPGVTWLRATPSSGASGVTTVQIEVLPNARERIRRGAIDFSGFTFEVHQSQGVGVPLPEALNMVTAGLFFPVNASETVPFTSGDDNWIGQTYFLPPNNPAGNTSAAYTDLFAAGQNSFMEAAVYGPGELSFKWSVSSETGFDSLALQIDNQDALKTSGETPWTDVTIPIPSGRHIITWVYSKDSSNNSGLDAALVDQVRYVETPALSLAPSSKEVPDTGEIYEIPVTSNGAWTITGATAWARAAAIALTTEPGSTVAGVNNGILRLTVDPNTATATRTATITLTATGVTPALTVTHTINQLAAPIPGLPEGLEYSLAPITTGGDQPWFRQTLVTYDLTDAAQSGAIADGQQSWMETTIAGPSLLRYYRKVSSEAGQDVLRVTVDGLIADEISGEVDWEAKLVELSPGSHVVRWTYSKNASGASGADAAYVDGISASPSMSLFSKFVPVGGLVYTVDLNVTGPWSVTGVGETFVNVWPRSGNGPAQLTVAVGRNTTGADRSAGFSVAGMSHAITQSSSSDLSVSPESFVTHAGAQTYDLLVGSREAAWTVSSPGLTVAPAPAPLGSPALSQNNLLRVTLPANTTGASRTFTVTITAGTLITTHTVTQAADNSPAPTNFSDAVDGNFTLASGGDAAWVRQAIGSAQNGGDQLNSGVIQHGQTSWVETTIVGPGLLNYHRRTDTEAGKDFLRVYINGVEDTAEAISGNTAWVQRSLFFEPGTHTVRWSYQKDAAGNAGADIASIDNLIFTSRVDFPYRRFISTGGSSTLRISLPTGVAWTISGAPAWLAAAPLSGTGSATVNLTPTANIASGSPDRFAFLNIAGETVMIAQDGTLLAIPTFAAALDTDIWTAANNNPGAPAWSGPWFAQRIQTHDGVDAMQSGNTPPAGSSILTTTVAASGGRVSFWWKTQSEGNGDILRFEVQNVDAAGVPIAASFTELARISGDRDWEKVELTIPAAALGGNTTARIIRFVYQKDADTFAFGADAGWVDQFNFEKFYFNMPGYPLFNPDANPTPTTVTTKVRASTDDAEELDIPDLPDGSSPPGDNQVITNASTLQMGLVGTTTYHLGLRFPGVNVPRRAIFDLGATTNAIQFKSSSVVSFESMGVNIFVEESLDAAPFSATPRNVTGRVFLQGDGIGWTVPGWAASTRGADQKTPNLGTLISQVTELEGWIPGNALGMRLVGTTGFRSAFAFDGNPDADRPELTLTYTGGNYPKTVSPSAQIFPIVIESNQDWELRLPDASWITPPVGYPVVERDGRFYISGIGNAVLNFALTRNTSGANRVAHFDLTVGATTTPTAQGSTIARRLQARRGIDLTQRLQLPLPVGLDTDAPVVTSGNVAWVGQNDVSADGVDGGAAYEVGHEQSADFSMNFIAPGTLTFAWRTDSELNKDRLQLLVDGVMIREISGQVPNFANVSENISSSGLKTVTWRFVRDVSGGAGTNTAYVDRVAFASDPAAVATALNNTDLNFNLGSSGWHPETETSHDGFASLASGAISNGGTSAFSTTVTGPGTLSFWWLVDSFRHQDFLSFKLNGVVLEQISGGFNSWTQVAMHLAPGTHTLEWSYTKDAAETFGEDKGWVDQIVWTGASDVQLNPVQKIIPKAGQTYTVQVTANGPWSVTDKPAWLTISPTSGTGNGVLTVTASANGSTIRTGVFNVGGVGHVASQSGNSTASFLHGTDAVKKFDISWNPRTGPMLLTWESLPDDKYRIQCSRDLITWDDIGGYQAWDYTSSFRFYRDPAVPRYFFRLIKLP